MNTGRASAAPQAPTGEGAAEPVPGPAPRRARLSGAIPAVAARNALPIALAAAVFLLTSALMLRFYVAGQLEMIPARAELSMRLTDESASYLDTGTWDPVRGARLQQRTEIHASPAPGNENWTAWQMSSEVSGEGAMLGHRDRLAVVNRTSGTAVNCCGEHVDGDRAVRQAGLVLLWPAGGTWEEYPFYDADIRAAPPMVFDGRDTVAGLETRRYVQRIDATQVPDSDRPVPTRALGSDRSGTVEANRWLELERTYWVEPVTGHVVNAREVRRETLRTETGNAESMLLDADFRLADELVDAKTGEASDLRTLLLAVRTWLPAGLAVIGALLLALVLGRELRARRSTPFATLLRSY